MNDPSELSASEARRLIGRGELSPTELLEACIKRIEAVNPQINAIVATDLKQARREAKIAENAVLAGNALPPLHGLPMGIKDLNATKGLRTTWGSKLFENYVPTEDEALVARLRTAGGIIVGKTNTPEFGSGTATNNLVYGPTLNPFDPKRTSGGSSGGSAAALATNMLPLCQGGDTGGSLRNPATWCGVVGFRPSPGLVPRENRTLNYTHFNVQGPMARSVPDIALMMTGCVGNDDRDPMANLCNPQAFLNIEPANLKNVRVAWTEDFGGIAPLDDRIRGCFKKVIGTLKNTFQSLECCNPDFSSARDCFWTLRCVNYLASHKTRYEKNRNILSKNIIANIEAGGKMSLADVATAETQWREIYRNFEVFFENIDLLIVPGNATSAFRIEDGIPREINGKKMENYMDASLIRSALTLTGHPVLALPCGYDHLGLPFGIQLVGKRRGDLELLEISMALEAIFSENHDLKRAIPNL
jgi:amidase